MTDLFAELEEKSQSEPMESDGVDLFAEADNASLKDMPEIALAPELNTIERDFKKIMRMPGGAVLAKLLPELKAQYGLMFADDEQEALKIITEQYPNAESRLVGNKLVINLPSGDYVINKEGFTAQDLVNFTAEASAYIPAGRAKSIGGAIIGNALTETAIDASKEPLGGDGASLEDSAKAGLLGGGFKAVENLAGAGYRAYKGKPQGEAAELIETAADNKVDLLTSDVYEPTNFVSRNLQETAEKIPFFGTGVKRETQQESRVEAVKKVGERYGVFSYEDIVKSLKDQGNKIKSAAGNTLSRTGEKLNELGPIEIKNTEDALTKAVVELDKKGVLKDSKAINDLYQLADTILENPQNFTLLKENRTAFREIVNSIDPALRSQLTSKAKSSLERVMSAMKDDMNDIARNNLNPNEYRQWVNANNVYASEASKLTKSRLKNVLDKGDIKPEAVETMLFSRSPSELRSLYKSLTTEGRQNARAAIMSKIYQNSINAADEVSPNVFATQMKKMGPQIDAFFKGKEKKAVRGFQKLLNATRRGQDASVTTPTGQSLFMFAGGSATALAPIETLLGGSALGGISRILENHRVRNAFARLDSIPPQSTQFEKVAREVSAYINSVAQQYDDQTAEEESEIQQQ